MLDPTLEQYSALTIQLRAETQQILRDRAMITAFPHMAKPISSIHLHNRHLTRSQNCEQGPQGGKLPGKLKALDMATQTEDVRADFENVSVALRRLRESRGLSQREVARRVGTSPSTICRLEDEQYHGHSLETIRRVASALDAEVNLGFRPKGEPPVCPKRPAPN